jgi:hypothetical protein
MAGNLNLRALELEKETIKNGMRRGNHQQHKSPHFSSQAPYDAATFVWEKMWAK